MNLLLKSLVIKLWNSWTGSRIWIHGSLELLDKASMSDYWSGSNCWNSILVVKNNLQTLNKLSFFTSYCGWDLAMWLERLIVTAEIVTVLGSIPVSSDTVESEQQQMNQCWLNKVQKKKIQKYPPIKKIDYFLITLQNQKDRLMHFHFLFRPKYWKCGTIRWRKNRKLTCTN